MEILHILLVIVAIFTAYFGFLYFNKKQDNVVPVIEKTSEAMYNMDAPVPAHMPKHVVEPSIEYPEETAKDPYANEQESSEIPERMRNPENMFKAAPDNNGSPINSGVMGGAPHAGVGGYITEMVQNEGEFMPGIFAFDKDDTQGFSMF